LIATGHDVSSLNARPSRALVLLPVGVGSAIAIAVGWRVRDDWYTVPDSGIGYWLGPLGLGMMVLLLAYSLRKRWSPLRNAGPIRRWFHIHMALGLLGPTAILFHANFHLGSLNANVALASMLLVSGSGIVGRFIYTHVHYEYRGRVLGLAELRQEAERGRNSLAAAERIAPELGRVLRTYEARALSPGSSWTGRLASFVLLGHRSRSARRSALRAYRQAEKAAGGAPLRHAQVARDLRDHVRAVRRVGAYAIYERAFALWHALHLPFCFVLFGAAAVHVVAVHMY